MKYVFMTCFALMIVASVVTMRMAPESRSDVPVLYWVTDNNPARTLQVETFHKWLEKHNYPRFELRVDTANVAADKIVIQGVSGVCGDIIGHTGGTRMRFRHSVGILTDVTECARQMGFDPTQTYAAMEPEITIDGRQYSFPCNVYVHMMWLNKATFRKYGLPVPPRRWTFEEFERIGRQFAQAANEPGKPRRHFFCAGLETSQLYQSLGASMFNETLSRCTLNDPRVIKALRLKHKWTYDDRLIPSLADQQSFAAEAGYGGATLQLFNSGNYAMLIRGRYALIQFREFGPLELAVSEPPHGGFPNTSAGTRAAAVYAGGKHQELARHFLAYLASEDYNMNIVDDADALPPNPKYTRTEAFLRPPKYPNEWGRHEAFSDALKDIAVPYPSSPFVLDAVASRLARAAEERFMSDEATAAEAAAEMESRINEEIDRSLEEDPRLRPHYGEMTKLQEKIDRCRSEGRKVPLEWIRNPFRRKYYVFKGWAEE